jgi:hypothetical protein
MSLVMILLVVLITFAPIVLATIKRLECLGVVAIMNILVLLTGGISIALPVILWLMLMIFVVVKRKSYKRI